MCAIRELVEAVPELMSAKKMQMIVRKRLSVGAIEKLDVAGALSHLSICVCSISHSGSCEGCAVSLERMVDGISLGELIWG